MFKAERTSRIDLGILIPTVLLVAVGIFALNSLSSLSLIYLIFILIGFVVFLVFASFEFEILILFSKYFYIGSIILLILPVLVGSATRGTIRWIQIGTVTIQPAELVRPFLLIFFANYLMTGKRNLSHLLKSVLLFSLPTFLILIQPSLGVTILTTIGFFGVFLATRFPKKYYLLALLITIISLPIGWLIMADYQKTRLMAFLTPASDPQGAGYNSLQAAISVGSGRIFGRGLGKGVGTQLAFLPERQSDFIFASISEELGLVGALVLLVITFYLLYRLIQIFETSKNPVGRAYALGFFLSLFGQIVIHVGMNLSILPITGVPYPLVSAGGSSLLATMIGLGIASSIKRDV